MLRTVPETINEEVDLYIRTYYSLLRSSEAIRVRSLEDTHAAMHASLHPSADDPEPDISAFTYAAARLPTCMHQVTMVYLGQSDEVFLRRTGTGISTWQRVYAAARRRKMFFDGGSTLACYIASVSDIDDLIPILTAYQIEWNKLHLRFHGSDTAARLEDKLEAGELSDDDQEAIRLELGLTEGEFLRLCQAWRGDLAGSFCSLAKRPADIRLNLLAGSASDYRQAVQTWWSSVVVEAGLGPLEDRSIYFVSSNPHSIPNLLTGFARSSRDQILAFLEKHDPEGLQAEWQRTVELGDRDGQENLLYYLQRAYLTEYPEQEEDWLARESEIGVRRVDNPHYLDVGAQIIELGRLDPQTLDPRLQMPGLERLSQSEALIVNVDYPLGMAAYNLFSQISARVPAILGVYIMGKAATLSGRVGDVMIPNVIYDEHSRNTYLFKNCFEAADLASYLLFGTVFDNQKSVTVRGTFLQNQQYMAVFYREGYTDIEMEAGPYLSAIYEDIYPQRYPVNEIVNLFINAPYDIGLLHYASDTPYSRRQHLLSKSMSFFGVDGTYASSIAIVRRIFQAELARLQSEV
ncbi:MAG: hypothetical protein U9R25_16230 [Chloroflexota bacterium]|nr:hypothetical protein [Chloroflexota bacterium]